MQGFLRIAKSLPSPLNLSPPPTTPFKVRTSCGLFSTVDCHDSTSSSLAMTGLFSLDSAVDSIESLCDSPKILVSAVLLVEFLVF